MSFFLLGICKIIFEIILVFFFFLSSCTLICLVAENLILLFPFIKIKSADLTIACYLMCFETFKSSIWELIFIAPLLATVKACYLCASGEHLPVLLSQDCGQDKVIFQCRVMGWCECCLFEEIR